MARTEDRFWSKVEATPQGCWLWTGFRDSNGYGHFNLNGNKLAHRVAFFLSYGRWPKVCRHRCDRPGCVNPAHLLDGTQADNVADAVARGRIARGFRLPHTKLTDRDAESIRAEVEAGGVQRHIAQRLGVSVQTINDIVKGRTHNAPAG